MRRRSLTQAAVALVIMVSGPVVQAQGYPSRPRGLPSSRPRARRARPSTGSMQSSSFRCPTRPCVRA